MELFPEELRAKRMRLRQKLEEVRVVLEELLEVQNKLKPERELAESQKPEIVAYVKGWAEGVRLYAIWKDGEQFVGVKRKPLFDVLEEGPDLDVLMLRLNEEPHG